MGIGLLPGAYVGGKGGNAPCAATANKEERAFFLSGRGFRISQKTVQWMVYKYLELAGLESKHYSVHKLRHTAATLMYQSGNVDIRVLKDILGHEQLNTTQIYTHVSDRSMEHAMQQNPLAGLSGVERTTEPHSDAHGESVTVSSKEELLTRKDAPSDPENGDAVPFRGENNLDYWITLTENR